MRKLFVIVTILALNIAYTQENSKSENLQKMEDSIFEKKLDSIKLQFHDEVSAIDSMWINELINSPLNDTLKYSIDEDEKYEPEFICTAPTQSLLQRWLREEHGLIISIEPTFTYALTTNVGYYAYVKKVNKEINTLEYLYLDIYFSVTYEESLEIGLLEALKLI